MPRGRRLLEKVGCMSAWITTHEVMDIVGVNRSEIMSDRILESLFHFMSRNSGESVAVS
jgi:hypothetical protein